MSGFSGVLQLTDLDDFITPSQVIRSQVPKTYIILGYECVVGVY